MPDATSTTLDLDFELRRQLETEAEAEGSTVSAFLASLLRDHVAKKRQVKDYDAWFDAEIEQALAEADDPRVERIPDRTVRTDLERRMALLQERL